MASSSHSFSSSSSSHTHQTKYDVFVSFRGEDVRHGFLSHLTKELRAKHIDAYVDERLESGEEISSALVTAIEGSMISLVIFSQHYATSKWCLEELVKIMECNKVNNQVLIPVFYNVDPMDVRHQKGTYGDAFAKHEQKYFKDNMEKLQSWRSSLNKAANLSGYHYPLNFENESKLIDKIVKDLLNKLKDDIFSDESRRLVGFDGHFAHVESLLEIESQEVKIIGLWGMGGIGKTTLAQVVCDKFSFKFESCCFMENVREESKNINGLSYLLQKLYCQLLDLDEENLNMYDAQTKRSIRRMLSRKKVLIVLDDVETYEQLEYLVGEKIYLGRGSRVIITSRDRHVLRGVHAMHEIGELNFEESLELFSLYAFNERNAKVGFEELSKSAVSYAKGIPLALKVLGSHLHSRNKEAWEDALTKLQKYPHMQIQHVLRVSYDGLDELEKNIFLDIAFFFKGHPKNDAVRVLNACGFHASSGIEQLLDKALITISDDNKIKMHDLLQDMGEEIVREESRKHPERRSRLNDLDDLYDVLQNNTGTDEIEGIVLDVSRIKNVCLSKDTFKKMPNLRILKMYSGPWCERSNVNVPFGIESFPDKLRYFHWDEYPLESLTPSFNSEKLIELRMERSQLKNLWNEVKDLHNLKILNLNESRHLIELPEFSKESNLETLLLSDCESLCRVHPSILSLHTLAHLDLARCHALNSHHINEVKCLTSLKKLSLGGCKQVNPMGVRLLCDSLRSLEDLDLENCDNLGEIPDNISSLSLLKHFVLNSSGVVSLPSSMKHLKRLRFLKLNFCTKLRSISELPPSLICLHVEYSPNLETVSPSRTCIIEDNGEVGKLELSFKQSVSLDEEEAMKFTSLSLIQAIHSNFSDPEHEVCYPGSRIPRWFTYNGTAGVPFVIQLDSTCDDQLLGFIVCGLLPQLVDECRICFFFFFQDGSSAYSNRVFGLANSIRDLAFMWFVPLRKITREGDEGRKYDEMCCYYICEVFGEAVAGTECGVCPIYASQFASIIEKILETERYVEIDDDQQQIALELMGSCTIEPVSSALELELAADKSKTSHDDIDDKSDEIEAQFQINLNRINPPPLAKEIDKQNERKGLKELLFL